MKRGSFWVVMLILAVVAGSIVLALIPSSRGVSLSSYSFDPNGVRAFYLLLSEEGFHVERKTGPIEETGDGVLIVFDADSLHPESSQALNEWMKRGNLYLVPEDPLVFMNGYNDTNAIYDMVSALWPYRDRTIWFDEYGRGESRGSADTAQAATPFSLLPVWLRAILVQLLLTLLLAGLFLGVHLGAPVPPDDRKPRQESEEILAIAHLMSRRNLWPDALRLCYRRLTSLHRRRYPALEQRMEALFSHPDDLAAGRVAVSAPRPHDWDAALALAAEMDSISNQSPSNP